MVIDQKIIDKLYKNPNYIKKLDASALLKQLDDAYYNKGITFITDELYDEIKVISGYENLGANVDKKVAVQLPHWMGSQNKLTTENEIQRFVQKYNKDNKNYLITDKLDGISALLVGNNEKCKLYTRGNGSKGQDITKLIPFLGIEITTDQDIAIRGELILNKVKSNEKVNTRNIVAGIVNRKKIDEKVIKNIDLVAYEVVEPVNMIPKKQLEFIKKNTKNVKIVPSQSVNQINKETLEKVLKERKKDNVMYDIDGIVVIVNQTYTRNKDKNPNYSFAFKNNDTLEEVVTSVIDIEWNPSKDGYIKPTIIVEQIEIAGVKIQRTTGFNAEFIVQNQIKKGTRIAIRRSGDVIPYITKVYQNDKTYTEKDLLPTQYKWKWNKSKKDIIIDDENDDNDEQKFKTLEHFYNVVKIKNLSTATLKKLFENGYKKPIEIYNIDQTTLAKAIGSDKMAEKIIQEREKIDKQINNETLMIASNAFGRGIGQAKIKLITENVDINQIKSVNDILSIKGISNITANQFLQGLENFKLWKIDNPFNIFDNTNIIQKQKTKAKNNTNFNYNVLFTGFRNKELEEHVENQGGIVAKTFNKDVNLLVVKDNDLNNAKVIKAQKNNIQIINQSELFKMLNLS